MTDKVQKIREGIEGLRKHYIERDDFDTGWNYALDKVLSLLDTFEEEPVSEELEEAAFDYAEACKYDGGEKLLCVEHFKAGAEWKKEQMMKEAFEAARKQLVADIWHKESEHPDNRHPYPVLNPDGEMAYAYYEELCGWQFDRYFKHSVNMLWLDIEKISPKKD